MTPIYYNGKLLKILAVTSKDQIILALLNWPAKQIL